MGRLTGIVLAVTATLAFSVPAAAQYPGEYYGGRYYGDRGYGGGYPDRERDRRRRYDRYDERDDYGDRRNRGDRRGPPSYGGGNSFGGPPASSRRGVYGYTCATRRGACPAGEPSAIGTECNCVINGADIPGAVR